eukprot:627705_1
MGVEKLYPYVRSSIQETFVFKKVNPDSDEGFNYKEIIFDGTCWLWRYMKGNYLMDYNDLRQTCQQMVDHLKQFGFKLVVFMDANICFNKLDTWLNRRASRSHLIFEFNDHLRKYGGHYPKQTHNNRYWFANNGCYFFVGQVFKSCGCDVYYAHIDCDREMIGYYKLNKHKAIGVCSVDSDFLIFDVDIYLEMVTMQFQHDCLYFKGYKHQRFLNRFQLKQHHLSQLAAIMGCDVLPRSASYIAMISKLYRGHISFSHGEVDLIAKYLRDLEKNERKALDTTTLATQDIKAIKKPKKKRGKSKRHHMNITKIRYNANIKRKFAIAENFYTPIYPLNLLDSPYLIMLMFQDYDDCKEQLEMNTNDRCNKGVILDSCMDDTSLIQPQECSAVVLTELRKFLYFYLTDSGHKFKDIVCFPCRKYTFHPSLLMNQWRKGITVDLNECAGDDNPLFKLRCYAFVKENTSDDIPCELLVEDIVFLLKWLKTNDERKRQKVEKYHEERKMNDNTTQQKDVATATVTKWSSSKSTKRRRKQKLKEMKRKQAMEMLNNRNVCESKHKMKHKDISNGQNRMNKGSREHRLWNELDLILESFVFQWKYRNVFLCKPYRNDIMYDRSRCNEYTEQYQKKMSPISMHFQSIIYGIYEIIFAFLRLYCNRVWFKKMYKENSKHENNMQPQMPCLKIYEENVNDIRLKLNEWTQTLRSKNVKIPFCWDVFNVKLYHWMFHNMDMAKQWINDCETKQNV